MQISKIQTTKLYRKIVIIFSICVVLLAAVIIYFSFSNTIVTVSLVPQDETTTFNIAVKKEMTEVNSTLTYLPGYLVTTTISDTKEFTNDAVGETVDAQATGTVTIFNNWSQEQPLAATTRLLTSDDILFRIKDRVDVPAGGQLDNVEVYADQPGISGNIEPTKFTIPGLWPGLQEQIYAESESVMTGGVRSAKTITLQTINNAENTLRQELIQKSVAQLEQTDEIKAAEDTVLKQAITSVILKKSSDVEIDQEADAFNVSMSIKAIGIIFNEDELLNYSVNKIEEALSADEKIYSYDNKNLVYNVEEYNIDDQTASLEVEFSAKKIPRLSSSIFNRENITNRDEQEIKAYFSNYDEVGEVQIHFSPFWVTKAPSLKDHIEIRIQE